MNRLSADISRLILVIENKQKKVLNHLISDLGYNFEFAHFKLLITAIHYPKELYAKNLTEMEGKSKSTINALLKKLEYLKLIAIELKPEDKRHKIIKVTNMGREVYEQISKRIEQNIFPELVDQLTERDQEELKQMLIKILLNLDTLIKERV